MATKKQTLINVQRLPSSERQRLREEGFKAFTGGRTAYRTAVDLCVNIGTVERWFRRFRKAGKSAVTEAKRGPATSERACLSIAERKALVRVMTDKTPDQLKFRFALWSSRAVVEYCRRVFGVTMSRRTARRYMKRLGFTSQCPIRRAREQNARAVAQWLDETYPAIREAAIKSRAKILWGDEAHVDVSSVPRRGYSKRGITPILREPANRSVSCSMVSVVGNHGDMSFMLFHKAMDADLFKKFLSKVVHDFGRTFLIVDNLRVHHAKVLEPWLEEHKDEIRLFFLPSYSPELNPDEQLNRDTKAALSEREAPTDNDRLEAQLREHLARRKREPEQIKKLFRNKECVYAAE